MLNPGKIVDAPPLTANLRYGPAYVTPDVATTFDFTADGGLLRPPSCAPASASAARSARARCALVPGDRATSSTARAAGPTCCGWRSPASSAWTASPIRPLREVLDLCLECKACKSECPTNVDMARLKAEFLHQYHEKHGLPWRNWVFGNVAKLSSWGARLPSAANRMTRGRLGRWLQEAFWESTAGGCRRRSPSTHSPGP